MIPTPERKWIKGNKQWVHVRFLVDCNAPPSVSDHRFIGWKPDLEAIPPGVSERPKIIVKLNSDAWGTPDEGEQTEPPIRGNWVPKKVRRCPVCSQSLNDEAFDKSAIECPRTEPEAAAP